MHLAWLCGFSVFRMLCEGKCKHNVAVSRGLFFARYRMKLTVQEFHQDRLAALKSVALLHL